MWTQLSLSRKRCRVSNQFGDIILEVHEGTREELGGAKKVGARRREGETIDDR